MAVPGCPGSKGSSSLGPGPPLSPSLLPCRFCCGLLHVMWGLLCELSSSVDGPASHSWGPNCCWFSPAAAKERMDKSLRWRLGNYLGSVVPRRRAALPRWASRSIGSIGRHTWAALRPENGERQDSEKEACSWRCEGRIFFFHNCTRGVQFRILRGG